MRRPLRFAVTSFVLASVTFAASAALVGCGARVEPLDWLPEQEGDTGAPLDTGVDAAVDGWIGPDAIPSDTSVPWDTGWDTAVPPDAASDTWVPPWDTGVDTGFDTRVDTASDTAIDTGFDTAIDTGFDGGDGGVTSAICPDYQSAACGPGLQACCTKNGVPWDALGCSDVLRIWCTSHVDAVNGGTETYDPTQAAACQTAWKTLGSACIVDPVVYLKTYVPCAQTFNGKTDPGGACAVDSDCRAPAGMMSGCDTSVSPAACRAYAVVGLGQACTYYGSTIRYCDNGLYCDYYGSRTCKTAKTIGTACSGTTDLSCGMGNVCSGGKCAAGRPAGATCTNDMQCAAWSCAGGVCGEYTLNVSSWGLCGG